MIVDLRIGAWLKGRIWTGIRTPKGNLACHGRPLLASLSQSYRPCIDIRKS